MCTGRHNAQGGKAAAETILDMRATGNFTKASTKEYEKRWMKAYGHDFAMVGIFCLRLTVQCNMLMSLLQASCSAVHTV